MGIVGEVAFGMWDSRVQTELRKRSNDKLGAAQKSAGEANERAETAALELAKFRARRTLSEEQASRLTEAMKGVGAMSFAVATSSFDDEIVWLMATIVNCLRDAGWKMEPYPWEIEGSVEKELQLIVHAVRFRAGGIAVSNVLVTYPSGNQRLRTTAEALAGVLNAEGIEASCGATAPDAQLVLVLIGPKR